MNAKPHTGCPPGCGQGLVRSKTSEVHPAQVEPDVANIYTEGGSLS
jgi:hypothetical protein